MKTFDEKDLGKFEQSDAKEKEYESFLPPELKGFQFSILFF